MSTFYYRCAVLFCSIANFPSAKNERPLVQEFLFFKIDSLSCQQQIHIQKLSLTEKKILGFYNVLQKINKLPISFSSTCAC